MKYVKYTIGALIAGASLYMVFKKTDFPLVLQTMRSIDLFWLFCSAIMLILSFLLKSLRWKYLLKYFNDFSLKDVFVSFSIGNMMNMLLPLRSGDLIRAFILSNDKKVSKASIIGTVVYEHILDFLMLFLVLCIATMSYDFLVSEWIKVPIFFLASCGVLFFIFSFIYKEKVQKIKKWKKESNYKMYDYLLKLFHLFVDKILCNLFLVYPRKELVKIFGYTLIIWLFYGIWLYTLFRCFDPGLNYHFSIGEVSTLMLALVLAVMIPSTPSYAGTMHMAILLVLQPTSIPQELIISYAILMHGSGTLIAIVIGLISWVHIINTKKFPEFNILRRSTAVKS